MNFLICGTRGTGKSTLALGIAKQWNGSVVVFDPRGSFKQAGIQCHSVEELTEHLRSGDYVIDGVPQPLVLHVDSKPEDTFNEMSNALFPPQFEGWSGRLAVIVDESRTLQSANYINPSLDRLVGQAPINDILVIQTTHEIKEWNSKSKSVMDEVFLFYQKGNHNEVKISELCGEEVTEAVKGFRPMFKGDPKKHHCVRYSFNEMFDDKEWQVWDDPSIWFSELGQQNRLPGNRTDESSEEAGEEDGEPVSDMEV